MAGGTDFLNAVLRIKAQRLSKEKHEANLRRAGQLSIDKSLDIQKKQADIKASQLKAKRDAIDRRRGEFTTQIGQLNTTIGEADIGITNLYAMQTRGRDFNEWSADDKRDFVQLRGIKLQALQSRTGLEVARENFNRQVSGQPSFSHEQMADMYTNKVKALWIEDKRRAKDKTFSDSQKNFATLKPFPEHMGEHSQLMTEGDPEKMNQFAAETHKYQNPAAMAQAALIIKTYTDPVVKQNVFKSLGTKAGKQFVATQLTNALAALNPQQPSTAGRVKQEAVVSQQLDVSQLSLVPSGTMKGQADVLTFPRNLIDIGKQADPTAKDEDIIAEYLRQIGVTSGGK